MRRQQSFEIVGIAMLVARLQGVRSRGSFDAAQDDRQEGFAGSYFTLIPN